MTAPVGPILSAVVALTLAGCSLPFGGETELGTTRLQVVLDEAEQTRPLLAAAENVVIRRCMLAQGLDHPFTVTDLDRVAAGPEAPLAAAAGWDPTTSGYRWPPPEVDPVNQAYLASLTGDQAQQYQRALFGAQTVAVGGSGGLPVDQATNGCQAQGAVAVAGDGDPARAARLVELGVAIEGLDTEVQALVDADPAYQEAIASWRACMTEAGHTGLAGQPLADPEDARDLALAVLWPEVDPAGPSADELRMATADRDCQEDAGLPLARFESYLLHEGQVIDRPEVGTLLATWEDLNERAVDVAIDLLSAEGLLP